MTAGSPTTAPWHAVTVTLEVQEAANMTRLATAEGADLRLLQTLTKGRLLRPFARLLTRSETDDARPDWWTLAALGTAAGAMATLILFVLFVYCRFRCHRRTAEDGDQGGDPVR